MGVSEYRSGGVVAQLTDTPILRHPDTPLHLSAVFNITPTIIQPPFYQNKESSSFLVLRGFTISNNSFTGFAAQVAAFFIFEPASLFISS